MLRGTLTSHATLLSLTVHGTPQRTEDGTFARPTHTHIRIGNERFDLVATVVGCRAVRHVFSLHARVETAWVAPKTKQG